ncbi:MAG TPA: hypothetical protein PLS27_04325 [Treponemataceae bacterium]|nr:hypothetical protein [Treponemataceae bacterium]HQB88329.1 hypothetical protein [Treponemataceae bacterium]
MKETIRIVLAVTITTLFVLSCASKPAVQDVSDDSPPPASEQPVSATMNTDPVPDEEKPDTEIVSVEPVEPELDYLYPEPDLVAVAVEEDTTPEEVREPTNPAEPITEKPAAPAPETEPALPSVQPAPEAAPALPSVQPAPEAAPALPNVQPATEAVPASPGAKPAPVSPPVQAASPAAEPGKPPVESEPAPAAPQKTAPVQADNRSDTGPTEPVVSPEEESVEPAAELWTEDDRVSEEPPPVERPAVVPSRSVVVPADGILEVWYPGTGWVYLGDASGLVGVAYETRKIDNRDTLFSFRARKTGSYLLEFSRYDVLTDEFIQDALSVTVTDPVPGKRTTVRAPDFILGKEPDVPETAGEEFPADSVLRDEPVLSGPLSDEPEAGNSPPEQTDDQLLHDVQARLASGDAPGALDILDQFFSSARTRLDEGWFLRGQAYEANSSSRNIRKALDAYETVVSAYPESIRWKDADERVRYIRQFYFRVR